MCYDLDEMHWQSCVANGFARIAQGSVEQSIAMREILFEAFMENNRSISRRMNALTGNSRYLTRS